MMKNRHALRNAALILVVFVATLVLLGGLALGISQRGPAASSTGSAPSGASPVASTPVAPSGTASPSAAGGSPSAPPVGDAVLVGAGDIGDCDRETDSATADLIDGIDGTVFVAGDNAYPDGTAKQYRDCYEPNWGRFKDRTLPVPGNHDYGTPGAAGYLEYFGDAAVNEDGDTWYSTELGAWHVIVLDSACSDVGGCKKDSPQGRWLAADLAASSAECTLALWHEPRFSSGYHGNDRTVGPFWELLYDAGADLVVNGHDHDYERFAPQAPDGTEDRDRGLREFIVGTGGTGTRAFEEIVPNSELRATGIHGVLKLTLRPRGYDWQFIPVTGSFSDSGSANCH